MTMLPIAVLLQSDGGPSFLDTLTFGKVVEIGILLGAVWLILKGAERLLGLLSDRVTRARSSESWSRRSLAHRFLDGSLYLVNEQL
jgi:hypothetical protein